MPSPQKGSSAASPNLHPGLALPLSAASLALAAGTVWPVPESVGAGEGGRLDLDLPIHARIALLAAYVAARRRPGGAKRAKGAAAGGGGAKRRKAFCGQQDPQPFSLEELVSHFEAIAQAAGASGADGGGDGEGEGDGDGGGGAGDASAGSVLSQVAGLLSHGLVASCTQEPLDGPRYRSLVRPPALRPTRQSAQPLTRPHGRAWSASDYSNGLCVSLLLMCRSSPFQRCCNCALILQVGEGLAQRVATNLKIDLARHVYCDT